MRKIIMDDSTYCPKCGNWQFIEVISSLPKRQQAKGGEFTTYNDKYKCTFCDHKWNKKRKERIYRRSPRSFSLYPDFAKQDGLIPVIVQEYQEDRKGKVLMLAYVNAEAYRLSCKTKLAHFWSRSRKEMWKKGETSSNFLPIKEIWLDCDQDTLLYLVTPPEKVCHLGKSDCFSKVDVIE